MGEQVNDEYMLDLDMAELLAMSAGFEDGTINSPDGPVDAEQYC
jgi:hypothetical protein